MEKELHIVNVGVSITTNFKKAKQITNLDFEKLLKEEIKETEIYKFVEKDPEKNSAELNSIYKKIDNDKDENEDINNKKYYFYFIGTNTAENRLCVKIIKSILEKDNYFIINPENKEIPGYYMEDTNVYEEFKKGISDLLEHLIKFIDNNKKNYDKIYLNPTGGYKPHVIATALAGFLTEIDSYYLNEKFKKIIFLPSLGYIPNKKEVEFMREICKNLNKREPISGNEEIQKLENKYGRDLIKKLMDFLYIQGEQDENGELYRIIITKKGQLYLKKNS